METFTQVPGVGSEERTDHKGQLSVLAPNVTEISHGIIGSKGGCSCVLWVPVTTAWRILRLRMEERPPIWRVAVNKLNKQPRTVDDGWSSSFGVGRGANNPCP